MNGLVMAAQLITALAILVTLHELGHFMAARAFGIRVEKFYLFFDAWGFKLFKFKKGDTEYGIGWLPFGGYVKIAGMVDESMDKEAMKQPPQPWEFRSKPAWQRLIVMVGGVVMNVLLGIVIFSFSLLHYNKAYLPVREIKDGIYSYELGRKVGFQTGDKIIAVNGKPVIRFEDIISTRTLFGAEITVTRQGIDTIIKVPDNFYKTLTKKNRGYFIGEHNVSYIIDSISESGGAKKAGLLATDKIQTINGDSIITFGSLRDHLYQNAGKTVEINILRDAEEKSITAEVDTNGKLGLALHPKEYKLHEYTFLSAFKYGISDSWEAVVSNLKGLGKVFSGQEKASDAVQGPIGIATIFGGTWDWQWFWKITGLLSMILAFMNILPVPALDGGHVIFLLFEVVTGIRLSDKFL